MTLEDEYKLYVEAYYGINEIDEYELKEYILKDVDKLINNYNKTYSIDIDNKLREYIKDNISIKTKLQSSLIVLNNINGPMELILLIRKKLKNLQ